jgi:hypothetical protein
LELFHPTSITASLSILLNKHIDSSLLSSSEAFTLHIDSRMHRSYPKNRDIKSYQNIPDVTIENAYVVLPQSGKLKVRSTDELTRKEREREEVERYERNKEAWYERNEISLGRWGDDGSYGGEFSPWGEDPYEDSWGVENDEEDESTEDESTEDESTEDESAEDESAEEQNAEDDTDGSDEDSEEIYRDDEDSEDFDREDNQDTENNDSENLGEGSNNHKDQGPEKLNDNETDSTDGALTATDKDVSVLSSTSSYP